jgi:hypothetical protein
MTPFGQGDLYDRKWMIIRCDMINTVNENCLHKLQIGVIDLLSP